MIYKIALDRATKMLLGGKLKPRTVVDLFKSGTIRSRETMASGRNKHTSKVVKQLQKDYPETDLSVKFSKDVTPSKATTAFEDDNLDYIKINAGRKGKKINSTAVAEGYAHETEEARQLLKQHNGEFAKGSIGSTPAKINVKMKTSPREKKEVSKYVANGRKNASDHNSEVDSLEYVKERNAATAERLTSKADEISKGSIGGIPVVGKIRAKMKAKKYRDLAVKAGDRKPIISRHRLEQSMPPLRRKSTYTVSNHANIQPLVNESNYNSKSIYRSNMVKYRRHFGELGAYKTTTGVEYGKHTPNVLNKPYTGTYEAK